MPDQFFVDATRAAHDAMVVEYTEVVESGFARMTLERALFRMFADRVSANGGPVVDVGCGPGHVTAHLRDLGLDVHGVDLSPEMVAYAREHRLGIRFDVGSMLSLDVPDASLGGVLAFYSIIHIPWEYRPAVLDEFRRVLRDGGWLLLGYQVGDEHRTYTEVHGHTVDLTWYRQRPAELAELLRERGFDIHTTTVSASEAPGGPEHGLMLARVASE